MQNGPNCLLHQVNGCPLLPKSINLQSSTASLNSAIKLAFLLTPPIFSFGFRISLKSPKQSHGREDKPANLLKRVHVCFFSFALGCPYTLVHLQHFLFVFLTYMSIWCLLHDLIWTSISLLHIKAKPPLVPTLSTTKITIYLQPFTLFFNLHILQLGLTKKNQLRFVRLENFLQG